jgi:hypothetical protein
VPRAIQVITSRGLVAAFILTPSLLMAATEQFTASGTFTVPAGVSKVSVQVWGGGAGGRLAVPPTNNANAGGGGGGFAALTDYPVSAGANFNVVVGAGGAANARGGASSFGGTAPDGCIGTTAPACAAGGRSPVPPGSYGGCSANPAALPADDCQGDEIYAGGNGGPPGSGSTTGGGGGGSAFTNAAGNDGLAGSGGGTGGTGTGNGGNGGTVGVAGTAGTTPGGGGGGKGSGAAVAPGAGAAGLVIVTYELDPPPAAPIPTASTWSLLLLGGLLGGFGLRKLRSAKLS